MRAFAASLLALAACGGEGLGEARFGAEQCRSVELVDADTGATVVGAEDLMLSFAGTELYVSAYDRLSDTSGGVYRLSVEALREDRIDGENLLPGTTPHGIWVDEYGNLTAISHTPDGKTTPVIDWSPEPREMTTYHRDGSVSRETKAIWIWEPKTLCSANDLATRVQTHGNDDGSIGLDVDVFATVDSSSCPPSNLNRVLDPKGGRILELADRLPTVRTDLRLPNGITLFADEFWVAEMRSRRLINLDTDQTIDLPGAPDNLNASSEGIVAALQPQLWRFGLYRYGYTDHAPTRIALIDPGTEETEILYDDPKGTLLSGATAAVLTDDGAMIASSVRGERLLVCEPEA